MRSDFFEKGYYEGEGSNYSFYEEISAFNSLAHVIAIANTPQNTLDVGCAKGFLVSNLRQLGINAYGIDISDYAISQNQRHRKFLSKVDAGSDRFPFKNNFFDLITCFDAIEHVRNHRHLLKECHRVLKKNGHMIISTPKKKYPWDKDATHINIHEPKFWVEDVEKHGFKIFRTYNGLDSFLKALFDGKAEVGNLSQTLKALPHLINIVCTPLKIKSDDSSGLFRTVREIFAPTTFLVEAKKI